MQVITSEYKNILQDEFEFSKNQDTIRTKDIASFFGVSIRNLDKKAERVLAHFSINTIETGLKESLALIKEKLITNEVSLGNIAISVCGGLSEARDRGEFQWDPAKYYDQPKERLLGELNHTFPGSKITSRKPTNEYYEETLARQCAELMRSGKLSKEDLLLWMRTQTMNLSMESTATSTSIFCKIDTHDKHTDTPLNDRQQHLNFKNMQAVSSQSTYLTSPRTSESNAQSGDKMEYDITKMLHTGHAR